MGLRCRVATGSDHAVSIVVSAVSSMVVSLGTLCDQGHTILHTMAARSPVGGGGSQTFVKRLLDSVVGWDGTVTHPSS